MAETRREIEQLLDALAAKEQRQRRNAMLYLALPLAAGLALTFWTVWQAQELERTSTTLEQTNEDLQAAELDLLAKRQELSTLEQELELKQQELQSLEENIVRGRNTLMVPDLTGRAEQEAALLLGKAGLKLGTITHEVSDKPPGRILRQSPRPGTRTALRTAVDVTVSQRNPRPQTRWPRRAPGSKALSKRRAAARLGHRRIQQSPARHHPQPNTTTRRIRPSEHQHQRDRLRRSQTKGAVGPLCTTTLLTPALLHPSQTR